MRALTSRSAAVLLPVLVLAACEQTKSSNPLSPSVAGPIAGVTISAPRLLQPAAGSQISFDQQPIALVVANSTTTGVRPLTYVFEIAADSGFANKIFTQTGVTPGGNGQTTLRMPQSLGADRTYFWRARAEDGANVGDYAAALNFKVYTPVVIQAPVPTAPVDGATLTTTTPKFTLTNASHTGPVGDISYVLEVATDSAFANKVMAVQYAESPGGTTSMTPTTGFAPNTRFYWHVKATDPGHESPWSATLTFTTPAAAPTPAPGPTPPPGGSVAPGDQLDLRTVVYVLGPNISTWAQTSTVTSTTTQDHSLCINHTKQGQWPTVPFFGDPGTLIEGNQWIFANINGTWYGGAGDWLRPGQACKDVTAANIGSDGFYNWEPLKSWSPRPGETFGLAVSTPARAWPDMRTVDERSNVVLVKWGQ
ncbi:MAG TPA: hypothetical protein VLT86_16195 [Vicinamibacterales bacterium]|nr:hypothetical protein [Vicinamibacterales bacterium]